MADKINEMQGKFIQAIKQGNLKAISEALKGGAKINAGSADGLMPLAIAAREGRLNIAQFLIKKGALIYEDALKEAGQSPKASLELLKYLQITQLRQVQPLTEKNSKLDAELLQAVYGNQVTRAKELLEKGAAPDAVDGQDTSALRWAARWGRKNIIKALLAKGADINLQSQNGWTVLMEATIYGSLDIIQLLIKNGALPNLKTFANASALYFAVEMGQSEIINWLKDQGAEYHAPRNS
jgi:ankyrin repeat protein